ncbi:MAG: hypothetical protein IKR46_00660 [Clostridia bacterium]|nr:hypothetical protein [Clostridia bacterium]
MPFINSMTNIKMSENQKEEIKSGLGKAMAAIGKPESYVMVNIRDECSLYFGGDGKTPCAMVEVTVLGKGSREKFTKVTEMICDSYNSILGIEKNKIYVRYGETEHWGYNGSNF